MVMKAKGRDSFLKAMRKKVPTPQPWITKVADHEVVHFSFLEMLCDLRMSSKFQDVKNNLCVNADLVDHFSQFIPMHLEDYSEIMARKWVIKMYNLLQDFNQDTNFFFGINIFTVTKCKLT
jgi:hypothetical protein